LVEYEEYPKNRSISNYLICFFSVFFEIVATYFYPKPYMTYGELGRIRGKYPKKSVYDTNDYGVGRGRRILKCESCGRTGSDKYGFTDTCANGVDSDKILIGEFTILHDLYFHELASHERVLLSSGNDVSSDNSS
jgi:hypothetical protein